MRRGVSGGGERPVAECVWWKSCGVSRLKSVGGHLLEQDPLTRLSSVLYGKQSSRQHVELTAEMPLDPRLQLHYLCIEGESVCSLQASLFPRPHCCPVLLSVLIMATAGQDSCSYPTCPKGPPSRKPSTALVWVLGTLQAA